MVTVIPDVSQTNVHWWFSGSRGVGFTFAVGRKEWGTAQYFPLFVRKGCPDTGTSVWFDTFALS